MTGGSESDSYPASFEALYFRKGSRLELFVRIIYSSILSLIAYFWSLLVGIAVFIQWFHILFLGRRSEKLWRFKVSYFRFYARMFAYSFLITDVRPPISGRSIPLPGASKPPEHIPPSAPIEHCINCGARLTPGVVYCEKCGQKIP